MISTKQLFYALAVEKTLHFKKAAERCNVSQSALSTALSELESQLKLKIFERDNRKVLITPIGKEVLQRAQQVYLQIEDLERLAEVQKKPLSFPISIGLIPTIAPFFLPKILPELRKEYPHAEIKVVEEQSHVLVDQVRTGEIDTAVIALPFPCEGLLSMEFWQEDFYWVAPEGETDTELKDISSESLAKHKLMLLSDGHCLKDQILDACRFKEHGNEHSFGATSLTTLIQMVRGGLGSTLIPEMALEQLITPQSGLKAVHLKENGPHRRIAFILRPNYTRTNSIEALIKLAKKSLSCVSHV